MSPSKRVFVALNLVLGPLVPLSYVWSARRWPEQLDGLWGSLPDAWQLPYVANMPLAALGYLAFTWLFLRDGDAMLAEGRGWARVNAGYALVLLPSIAWMPLTCHALATGHALGVVIQVVLAGVAAGSLLLAHALLKLGSGSPSWRRRLARLGMAFFCLQTVVLDALIWPRYFSVG